MAYPGSHHVEMGHRSLGRNVCAFVHRGPTTLLASMRPIAATGHPASGSWTYPASFPTARGQCSAQHGRPRRQSVHPLLGDAGVTPTRLQPRSPCSVSAHASTLSQSNAMTGSSLLPSAVAAAAASSRCCRMSSGSPATPRARVRMGRGATTNFSPSRTCSGMPARTQPGGGAMCAGSPRLQQADRPGMWKSIAKRGVRSSKLGERLVASGAFLTCLCCHT